MSVNTAGDINSGGKLYDDVQSAAAIAAERLEKSTREAYQSSLQHFAEFCEEGGYPDPRSTRYPQIPSLMAARFYQLSQVNTSVAPAEKLRSAVNWHYTTLSMLTPSQPADCWVEEEDVNGNIIARGNPAKAQIVRQVLRGLVKLGKRAGTAKRAVPMSLQLLGDINTFVDSENSPFNEVTRR
ncbi:hypothetical protein BBJ28_00011338, partial [Nothophytophthora sp. Chile5]